MDRKNALKIVENLLKGTREQKLEWEESDFSDVWLLLLPHSSARIKTYASDRTEEDEVLLDILNQDGTVVDSIAPADLQPQGELLWDLYREARRSALKAESVIEHLLEDLAHRCGKP